MLKHTSLFFVALMAVATSLSAQTYKCSFRGGGHNGTISPDVRVVFDGNGGAMITDRLSERHGRAPVKAKLAKDDEKLMRVQWRLEDVISSSGQKATLEWSLVHKKKRNKAHLRFNAFGYGNTEAGNGTCALVE